MTTDPVVYRCDLFCNKERQKLFPFLTQSCAHVISEKMRSQASKGPPFKEVQADPDRYIGKVVIWGGIIIETIKRLDGAYIKILQTPLARGGEPRDAESSKGPFLLKYPTFLYKEIYRKGRKLSIAGEIIGKEILPIGEISYTCPFILAKALHLWKEVNPPIKGISSFILLESLGFVLLRI